MRLFKIVKAVIVMIFLTLIFMGYITQQFRYKFNNINKKQVSFLWNLLAFLAIDEVVGHINIAICGLKYFDESP